MNAIEIARAAIDETQELAQLVSADVRLLAAFGKVALLVEGLGNQVNASTCIHRMQEAMHEVRCMLSEPARPA